MTLRYGLNEEQRMIADSAEKLFADQFPSSALRAFLSERQVPEATRQSLGESGLLGICAPADVGSSGLGAEDALAILIAAGRHAAPWPVAESITAVALLAATHRAQVEAVMNASAIAAFLPDAALDVKNDGKRWQISGTFDIVPWAPLAQLLIFEASLGGQPQTIVVDAARAGITIETRKCIDPLCPTARIRFSAVVVGRDDVAGNTDPHWKNLRTLFACAEMLGAAQTALALSIDYMKVRKQFGHEIGRFQALKHIAANDALHIESLKLATEYAAWAHDTRAEDAEMALHIAKQYGSIHARGVAEDAIQCHGGIGFTWDYDLHFYLRRILRLGAAMGTVGEHREAIAKMLVREFSA